MKKSYDIGGERTLVFSDIHQNTKMGDAILAVAGDGPVVFLGDAFDTHLGLDVTVGVRETAAWYKRLLNRPNCTVLLGNHDVPYFESHGSALAYNKKLPLYNWCPGFTPNRAIDVAKELTYEDWKKARLMVFCNGYLLTHGGVVPEFWNDGNDIELNLENLSASAHAALVMLPFRPSPVLAAGVSRGGTELVPGFTWCDFDYDFVDSLPVPQIVGHTSGPRIRQKGRSYCIDAFGSYCWIEPDGKVTFHRIVFDDKGVQRIIDVAKPLVLY